uniref:Kinesin motor domain-containing protein n=1 Tax=Macrostomum lignano TaxID=282301 RepID=A0A1I8IQB1_9PLAT
CTEKKSVLIHYLSGFADDGVSISRVTTTLLKKIALPSMFSMFTTTGRQDSRIFPIGLTAAIERVIHNNKRLRSRSRGVGAQHFVAESLKHIKLKEKKRVETADDVRET